MAISLSKHLAPDLGKRRLKLVYIERAFVAPDWTLPEPGDPSLTRAFKVIPKFGNRVLRVVYRLEGADIFGVTAHWDRGARR